MGSEDELSVWCRWIAVLTVLKGTLKIAEARHHDKVSLLTRRKAWMYDALSEDLARPELRHNENKYVYGSDIAQLSEIHCDKRYKLKIQN